MVHEVDTIKRSDFTQSFGVESLFSYAEVRNENS